MKRNRTNMEKTRRFQATVSTFSSDVKKLIGMSGEFPRSLKQRIQSAQGRQETMPVGIRDGLGIDPCGKRPGAGQITTGQGQSEHGKVEVPGQIAWAFPPINCLGQPLFHTGQSIPSHCGRREVVFKEIGHLLQLTSRRIRAPARM